MTFHTVDTTSVSATEKLAANYDSKRLCSLEQSRLFLRTEIEHKRNAARTTV
jgi:hypothetical protein